MAVEPPRGYDLFYSEKAQLARRRDLNVNQLLDLYEAIESLLTDPTEANPYVTDASGVHGYQRYEYVMVWGELTITYQFVNDLVVQVSDIRVLPRLGEGRPTAE